MMIPLEIDRIASAIHRLRPDWRSDSLRTFIANHLIDRPYRDVALALTWVALDPRTKTPNLVLSDGEWWAAAHPRTEPTGSNQPPGPGTCAYHRAPLPCRDCDAFKPASSEQAARHIAAARAAVKATRFQTYEPQEDQ